jgi:hypothetical protein
MLPIDPDSSKKCKKYKMFGNLFYLKKPNINDQRELGGSPEGAQREPTFITKIVYSTALW